MTSTEELMKGIPQTPEEMDRIRNEIGKVDSQKTLDKAFKINARIERCKRMKRMFDTEEFKEFWLMVNEEMKAQVNQGVDQIKGHVTEHQRYDPLGQLAQLNIIQGGLEILQSQAITKATIEENAKMKEIDTQELEEKIKIINQ